MTSAFLTRLVGEDSDDGLHTTLTQPLVYRSAQFGGEIVVPAGFTTDFASIPQFLWNVLPQHGRYDRAAVLHDQAYQTGAINGRVITRDDADALLAEAMIVCAVPRWQRWTILAGLKVGGGVTWNRYRAVDPVALQPAGEA